MKISDIKLLNEGTKYDSMFDKIRSLQISNIQNAIIESIDENILWARKNLKREDRIVWYLRLVKLKLTKSYIATVNRNYPENIPEEEIERELNMLGRDMNKFATKLNMSISDISDIHISRLRGNLEHFLSLTRVEKIQKHIFTREKPQELFSKLTEFENEWKESIGEGSVAIQEGDKLVVSFDNGTRGWWLLNRHYCSDEADSMGHCGNSPSNNYHERILSFRTHVTEEYWKPHLTFILDGEGRLGEMKGRGNEKPAEKYHPYIIKLLEREDIISGIKGGGYLPENNFSLTDLDESDQERLLEINPNLLSIFEKYKKYGLSDKILDEVMFHHQDSNLPVIEGYDSEWVHLETFTNGFKDIGEMFNIEPLQDLYNRIEALDIDDKDSLRELADEIEIDEDLYRDIIDKLPNEVIEKIKKDLGIDIDISKYVGQITFIDKVDKSRYGSLLRQAVLKTDNVFSTDFLENDKIKNFISLITEILEYNTSYGLNLYFEYDEENVLESEVITKITMNDFIEIVGAVVSPPTDEYDEGEGVAAANSVLTNQSWLSFEEYELKETFNHLSGENINSYANYPEEWGESYKKFMKVIGNDNYRLDHINPSIVASLYTRMIQYNESRRSENTKIINS